MGPCQGPGIVQTSPPFTATLPTTNVGGGVGGYVRDRNTPRTDDRRGAFQFILWVKFSGWRCRFLSLIWLLVKKSGLLKYDVVFTLSSPQKQHAWAGVYDPSGFPCVCVCVTTQPHSHTYNYKKGEKGALLLLKHLVPIVYRETQDVLS